MKPKRHPHISVERPFHMVTCKVVYSSRFTLTNYQNNAVMRVAGGANVGELPFRFSSDGDVDAFPFADAKEAFIYAQAYWDNEPVKPAGVPDIGKGSEQVGLFS